MTEPEQRGGSLDSDRVPAKPAAWPPAPQVEHSSTGNRFPLPRYVSPYTASRRAIWLKVAQIITGALYAYTGWAEIGHPDIFARVDVIWASLIDFVVVVISAVLFAIWIYRIYANGASFGAQGLSTTPGWAVAYLFIPVLNLYKPYQVVQEAWKASDPGYDFKDAPDSWRNSKSDLRVGLRWALMVAN